MTKKLSVVLIMLYVLMLVTSCSNYDHQNVSILKQVLINITIEHSDFSTKCLGTAISADGNILTTAHSFKGTYDNTVISTYCHINATKYVLEIISIDFDNDLALLHCDYNFMTVATYKESYVDFGDILYLATDDITTHSLYKAKVICGDQIVQYDTYSRNLISINANACYGDSGAPLVDSRGNLIGILCAKLTTDNTTFFAVKGQTILKFLEEI